MISENVASSTDTLDPTLAPDYDVAEVEGEEWVSRALEELEVATGSRADCVAEATIEGKTSSTDIIGSMERKTGGELEVFTFAGLLQPEDLISETPLESVVDMYKLPLC